MSPAHVIQPDSSDYEGGQIGASVVLPKQSHKGIKLDIDNPDFGWHDILGEITVRGAGLNNPTFAQYGGTNLYAYEFSATIEKEVFIGC